MDTSTTPESLGNVELVPSAPREVKKFLKEGKIFQGGNAQALHKMLSLSSGDRLLYVGDHVYSDVLRSKRTLGWRTCLIIPELTNEIMVHKRQRIPRAKLLEMRQVQFEMEKDLDKLISADNEIVDLNDQSTSDVINEVNILRRRSKTNSTDTIEVITSDGALYSKQAFKIRDLQSRFVTMLAFILAGQVI